MPAVTARRAADVCHGRLTGDPGVTASRVVADSRELRRGDAFVAVHGGHRFVDDAVAAGAAFVIVPSEDDASHASTAIVVDDTVRAIGLLAADVRAGLDVRVVGITGSTGKTLTKDLAAAVLSTRHRVHAAPSSYNNEVGVPLVVLGCPDDTDVVVAELGARHPGEIGDLCGIVRPSVGVLTGVGSTHLSEFGTRDAIARTKSELLAALPADGLGIVPSDDDFLDVFAQATAAKLTTVGPGGDVRYRADRIDRDGHTHGTVSVGTDDYAVTVPLAGRALLRNAAMAMRVGLAFGVEPAEAVTAIADARTSAWRMTLDAIGDWTILNDAYNANPTSVASALRTGAELAEVRGSMALWAVLGEMAELGPRTHDAHVSAGRLASSLYYDGVVVVGQAARGIAEGAGGIAHRVDDVTAAATFVRDHMPSGALVVVKASRVVGLERLPADLERGMGLSRREA